MAGEGRIDSVSMNRRRPDGPIDTAVRVLRVEGEDGELRAALVNYGCHPTILNHDTLEIGRDWPGHVDRAIKALWGADAAVLFANGACADINPVKISEDHRETRRVGTIVGAEAARVLGELAAHGKEQVVHNLLWSERPVKPPSNGVAVSPGLAGAIVEVALPWKSWPSDAEYEARLASLRGRIEATTGSGDIRAFGVAGGFSGKTGSGSVELDQVAAGDVTLSTGSGNLKATGVQGELRAQTGSGDISVQGIPTGVWNLRASSGGVTLRLGNDAGFDLDARTDAGQVTVNHPVTVVGSVSPKAMRGKVRGGGAAVEVRSGSGDIRIE